MAYSSGTFSRLYDWTTDRDAGVKIRADRMDAEFDGIATGLTTAILKDGTQTTTATVPFAYGISIVDNKAVTLGTNSDYTIQYDETTRDSLMLTSNVEGAVFSMVLAADQGDDAGDEWKIGIADGGVLTLGNDINSAHTYVAQLTLTPNSTVASSTTAVAGNLTVGGSLTLGSGAVLSEAELEMLDGITAGTVAASKAVVVDANLDAASFRNITLTGELDAGSLDVSGDADIDGTLEADAITVGGTALNTVIAGVTVTDATNSAHVLVTDNESTNEENLITFVEGATDSTGNVGLEMDGNLSYNPSTGTVTATIFKGNIDAVDGDFDGTLEADAMTLNGTAITTTATLSTGISNGNVLVATSGVADNDFLRVDGTSIEGRSASEVLSDIGASAVAGSSSIVTTGALDSGSITSGFGAIDNGTSGIRTDTFTAETSIVPSANDGATLGTASLGFADLFLADGGIIKFGDDQDVTVTHDADDGLILKSAATGDDNPFLLTLQTGETDLAANDVIGKIAFQAPDEGTGTDAILVSAAIQARSEGDFAADANATSIDFMTGASEAATTKMTLTSGGKLSLGVASGGDAVAGGMHIHSGSSGSVSANAHADELVIESSGRGGISILTPDANESNILFGSPSDNLGGFISYKQSNTTMELGTSIASGLVKVNVADGTLNTTFEADGDVNISNGNLVVASGHGIDFSATSHATGMSSELLDSYETGTWTASFQLGSGSVTINSSFNTGQYIRIGSLVYFNIHCRVSAVSSPSGKFDITGLPFNFADNGISRSRPALSVWAYIAGSGLTAGDSFQAMGTEDTDEITIHKGNKGETNYFNHIGSHITTSTEFSVTGVYTATI